MLETVELRSAVGYQRALDGVRAVAIIMVVAFHTRAAALAGGWLGVDVFFALSGFLITGILLRERARGSLSLGRFYAKRALRLVPAAIVLIAAFTLVALVTDPSQRDERLISALGAVTYSYNILAEIRSMTGLGHMWSLALEEQFYLLWPAALLACLRHRNGLRLALVVIVSLAAVMTAWRLGMVITGHSWTRVAFGPERADSLLIGSGAAILVHQGRLWISRIPRWVPWVTGVLLLVATATADITAPAQHVWLPEMVAVAASLTMLRLVTNRDASTRFLGGATLVWLGRLSYSLYLWHYPIMQTVFDKRGASAPWILAAIVASLIAACLSYYVVERPFLRIKERLSVRSPAIN